MTTSRKPIYLNWFALFIFSGVGLIGYLMKATDWFHSTPGDLIDARFNSVILEHLYKWLKIGLNGNWTDVWSPTFFYPYQNTLAFSDNHFGSALSYLLLRYVGFTREISFSGWYVMGFFLNFSCSFWVFRRFQFNIFSSSAAAFVFSFSLPVIAQDVHSQFSYRFAIPLAFLAFCNLINSRSLRALAWLTFWISLQFFCSIYMGAFLLIYLAACSLPIFLFWQKNCEASFLEEPRTKNTASKLAYLLLLIVSFFASLALAMKYQSVSQQYGFTPDPWEIRSMIPRLESYLIADRSELSNFIGIALAENLSNSPYRGEHQLFLGIGVLIFFVLGTYYCWGSNATKKSHPNQIQIRMGRIAFIAFVTIFLGTLMFGIGSAWMQFADIPGIKFIRAVSRIILIMIFPVSIIVAIACEKLYYSAYFDASKKKIMLISSVAILLCIETIFFQNSKTSNKAWAQRIENLMYYLPHDIDKNKILFVPKDETKPGYELPEVDAMILAQDIGIPTVNGYSGKFPPGNHHNPIERCISAQERLEGYAKFKGTMSKHEIAQIMKQIVIIPTISCRLAK